MASGINLYMKLDTLKTLVAVLEKKGEKGIGITAFTRDEADQYGNNVSGWVAQSKEEKEAKKDRYFVANGKVFWTDGKPETVPNKAQPQQQAQQMNDTSDDLPF